MTDMTLAAEGGDAVPVPVTDGPISVRDAGRALSDYRVEQRRKDSAKDSANDKAPTSADPAQQNSADAPASADADPDSQAPGETTAIEPDAGTDVPDAPPIEPPRSWTKEEKERFKSLPRETQDYLATREQEREREFRRGQNEAAEHRKALEADRQRAEQARAQYEAALPALLQTLQSQQAGEFGDIRTLADIEKLAREDFPRYVQWDAQQKKIAAIAQQAQAAQARQAQENRERWSAFAKRQDELFIDKVPEFADQAQSAKLQHAAVDALRDLGFEDGELTQLWNGQRELSLRDHRLQLLIRDGVLWREAQHKAKAAAKKPLPPVQRPGVSQARGAAQEAQVSNLGKRLDQSGSLKDAAALLRARRAQR